MLTILYPKIILEQGKSKAHNEIHWCGLVEFARVKYRSLTLPCPLAVLIASICPTSCPVPGRRKFSVYLCLLAVHPLQR